MSNFSKVKAKKDKKGLYKICESCGKKYYYEEYKKERKRIGINVFNKSRYCCLKCRKVGRENKKKYEHKCYHCGKTFYSKRKEAKICSVGCNSEYLLVNNIGKKLGLDYETMKKELLKIAEKYRKI